MREEFQALLTKIQAMNPPTAVKVMMAVQRLWDERPSDDDEPGWEMDFVPLTQEVCTLSTCADAATMDAWINGEATGYALFADAKHAVEFNQNVLPDQTFTLYPWEQIKDKFEKVAG